MEQKVEQNVEVKDNKPKKKRNWLFTLFACIATGVIVFLAMNIGQNLSKTVEPNTNKSNNKEVVCEKVECDCEAIVNSESNSNSNTTTQQQPQTQPTNQTYTESTVAGTYKSENGSYIVLNKNGLFEIKHANYYILGNYVIENNTLSLNEMIQEQNATSTQLDKVITVNLTSTSSITLDGQTYTRTENDYGMTMQSWGDVIEAYVAK